MNGFNHAPEDSDWDHDHIQYDLRPYDHRKEIEILPQVDKFSRGFWLFLWNLISTKHHKTFHSWIWSSWNIPKIVIQEINPRENQEKSSKNENEWQEVDIFHGLFFFLSLHKTKH